MFCHDCGNELPTTHAFKFCPFCGTALLVAAATAPENTDPYVEPAKTPPADEPPTDATIVGRAPSPMSTADTLAATVPDPDADDGASEAPTIFEMPAVDPALLGMAPDLGGPVLEDSVPALGPETLQAKKGPGPVAASVPPEAVPDTEKPTVLSVPAVSAQMLEEMLDRPDDISAPKVTAPPSGGGQAPGDAGFSETAWFMAAVSPEQLAESEGEALSYTEQDIMTERYEVGERLPDEVRKDFSLTMDRVEAVSDEVANAAVSKKAKSSKKRRRKD